MRALVQRVSHARVVVAGNTVGQIGRGLLVLLGVGASDSEADVEYLSQKIAKLRIFPDNEGRMNLSALETRGELLIVSQFTLYADTRKGNRPSYSQAANPEIAKKLYDLFVDKCRQHGLSVATGVFQAHMDITLVNDGPVTLMCYSGE
jgi:D-aminoacyl-tRNA deacylase